MCHADRLKKTSLDDALDLSPDNDLFVYHVQAFLPRVPIHNGMHIAQAKRGRVVREREGPLPCRSIPPANLRVCRYTLLYADAQGDGAASLSTLS